MKDWLHTMLQNVLVPLLFMLKCRSTYTSALFRMCNKITMPCSYHWHFLV